MQLSVFGVMTETKNSDVEGPMNVEIIEIRKKKWIEGATVSLTNVERHDKLPGKSVKFQFESSPCQKVLICNLYVPTSRPKPALLIPPHLSN
jgi:hypothetical protein